MGNPLAERTTPWGPPRAGFVESAAAFAADADAGTTNASPAMRKRLPNAQARIDRIHPPSASFRHSPKANRSSDHRIIDPCRNGNTYRRADRGSTSARLYLDAG